MAYLKHRSRALVSWFGRAMNIRDKEIFDYEFAGVSVWLEPDEDHSIETTRTMANLAEQCGGAAHGLYEFAPHCTMLYNIPLQQFLERSSLPPNATVEEHLSNASQDMLDHCVKGYELRSGDINNRIMLHPMSLQCFRYPPFSCVITFLHLDHSNELEQLHHVIRESFPPDERHQSSRTLMPHMSLVYAPEAQEDFLMKETARLASLKGGKSLLEPMRAKYLSVWSTEGKISDWKRIAKVELP